MLPETKDEKVVQFKKDSVYKDIEDYLEELEVHSKKTRQSYERDIKDYYKIHKGLDDIKFLTREDLQITKKDLEKYRQKLMRIELANSTINRKIKALKSLMDSLNGYGYRLDTSAFIKWKWLNEATESCGTITLKEAEQMALVARNIEKVNAEMKYYLIKLATRTSYRISDLLKLEWKHFDPIDEDIVLVKVYEKKTGKYAKKPITLDFYRELQSIRVKGQNKLFKISSVAVSDMMNRITEHMGISPDRRISFHSIRSVAINLVLEYTSDIVLAAKQGNHSDINTTYKHYIEKTENYNLMGGMLIDKELNYNILHELTKEELIQLIMGVSKKSQYEIITQAENTLKHRK